MALTVSQILSAIAPQFVSSPGLAVFEELAKQQTSASFWGAKYAQAVALRMAHMMTLASPGVRSSGEAGAITSKREGDLSVSFGGVAQASIADSDLAQTSFGLQLIALRKGAGMVMSVTGFPGTLPAVQIPGAE